ncbi:uncharacterized protein METZ01_LOCUS503997, partial [marine metagenome]
IHHRSNFYGFNNRYNKSKSGCGIFYAPHHRETNHCMDFDSDFCFLSCSHVFPINYSYRSDQDL